MHQEQIVHVVENRRGRFPILECQERFFGEFNQAPQPITYDELMRENFENTAAPLPVNFDDTMGQCGTDALAYYLPFHGNANWGIYILDAGVDILAEELVRISRINLPGGNNLVLSRLDAEYLAKHKLLLHELGHHAVEIVNTLLEIDPDPNRRIPGAYRTTRLPGHVPFEFHENEEAVCNWNVKRQKHEFKIRALDYFDPITNFMLRQPPGYNRFGEIQNSNLLENILNTRLTGPIQPETRSNLHKEFFTHSTLPRVRPSSVCNRNIGFVVPLYLIRTD